MIPPILATREQIPTCRITPHVAEETKDNQQCLWLCEGGLTAWFLMVVGNSSAVYRYTTKKEAEAPNLPTKERTT